MVVWWSECSSSTQTIRVRIPLKSTILKRKKNHDQRPGITHFFKKKLHQHSDKMEGSRGYAKCTITSLLENGDVISALEGRAEN